MPLRFHVMHSCTHPRLTAKPKLKRAPSQVHQSSKRCPLLAHTRPETCHTQAHGAEEPPHHGHHRRHRLCQCCSLAVCLVCATPQIGNGSWTFLFGKTMLASFHCFGFCCAFLTALLALLPRPTSRLPCHFDSPPLFCARVCDCVCVIVCDCVCV